MNKTTQALEPELQTVWSEECEKAVGGIINNKKGLFLDEAALMRIGNTIAADRNKREGEPAATAVPYGWINAGTDQQQTEYATLHVGPENPWKETANAFPVYAAPVSAGLSDEEKSNLQELIRYLEAVDAHAQADTVRALAARLRLPEGYVAVKRSQLENAYRYLDLASGPSGARAAFEEIKAMIAAAHNEVQDKPMPGQQEE